MDRLCLGWRSEGADREVGKPGEARCRTLTTPRGPMPMTCDGRSLERCMSVSRLFSDRSADRGAALRRHGRAFEARARTTDEERCARGEECPNADNYRQSAHASLLNRVSRLLFGGLPSQRVDDCSVRRQPGIRFHEKKWKFTLIHAMDSGPYSVCRTVVLIVDGDAHDTSYARWAGIVKRLGGDCVRGRLRLRDRGVPGAV